MPCSNANGASFLLHSHRLASRLRPSIIQPTSPSQSWPQPPSSPIHSHSHSHSFFLPFRRMPISKPFCSWWYVSPEPIRLFYHFSVRFIPKPPSIYLLLCYIRQTSAMLTFSCSIIRSRPFSRCLSKTNQSGLALSRLQGCDYYYDTQSWRSSTA